MPAISVIMPVYNAEAFLAEAIESILNQTYTDFEFIIIDDGSTDGSGDIIRSYAALDSRIRHLEQENQGVSKTLNRGISCATGEFIARMDADDISYTDRFNTQYEHLLRHPEVAVLGTPHVVIRKDGSFFRLEKQPVGRTKIVQKIGDFNPISHPTVMLRKSIFETVGMYRHAFNYAEDYDLWLRVHDAGFIIENLKKPLLKHRRHDLNVTHTHTARVNLSALIARLAHRARCAGIVDPTRELLLLEPGMIELFPLRLRLDIEAENFVLRCEKQANEGTFDTGKALQEFQELNLEIQKHKMAAKFFLIVSNEVWKQKRIRTALYYFALATIRYPRVARKFLSKKLRHRIRKR